MEMRLRWYIDESEAWIICRFEEPLVEMNRKMDIVIADLATLQRVDASVVNILREEHLEEEEGETSAIGGVQAVNDRLTYETPNTEVHSEVFVDEALVDIIVEVISPISKKKIMTRKLAPALLTSFIAGQRPKKRKNEVRFDPLQPVDPSQMAVLMQWVSSKGELKTIRGGTFDLLRDFFRTLIQTGEWLSNEVKPLHYFF